MQAGGDTAKGLANAAQSGLQYAQQVNIMQKPALSMHN